jgi:hypothetical protein
MLPWVSAFQGSLSETFPGPFDSGSSHTLCRPEDCSSDPPAPQSVDRSPTSSIRSVVPKHEARTEHPHRLFAPARSLAFGHCAPRAMCSLLIVSCITADQTDDLWGTFLPCRSRRDSLAVPDIRVSSSPYLTTLRSRLQLAGFLSGRLVPLASPSAKPCGSAVSRPTSRYSRRSAGSRHSGVHS